MIVFYKLKNILEERNMTWKEAEILAQMEKLKKQLEEVRAK